MTCVYLLRHGQSLGNIDNLFLGHTDWGLTELGKKQADCVINFFKDINIDKIYSSDLIRARETAQPTAENKNLEIIGRENLREIYAGKWEGLSFDEIDKTYPEMWDIWKKADGENLRIPDGESIGELTERIYSEIKALSEENDGKTLLIATHAVAIRCFTNKVLSRPLSKLCETAWVPNASVSRFVYENGEFKIDFLGNAEHLGELVTAFPKGV